MSSDSISEATFLLTELQYTLGQLHVQVLDLEESQREDTSETGRSVNIVLQEMSQHEAAYQKRIGGLIGAESAASHAQGTEIPLPISNAEEDNGSEHDFELQRADTIATLQALGDVWPVGLVSLVREQVQHDRQLTTELANLRMRLHNQDNRSNLDIPLTRDPEPHQLEHS